MGVREVDETQFLASQSVVKTVNEMLANPEARKRLLEAQKIVNPKVSIPEIDAVAPVREEFKKVHEELSSVRKELKEAREKDESDRKMRDLNNRWESGRQALRSAGYNDEGIKAVEELMEKKGILDHEDGLAIFERLHPPAQVLEPGGRFVNYLEQPKDDGPLKAILESHGKDDNAVNQLVNQTLAEMRRR